LILTRLLPIYEDDVEKIGRFPQIVGGLSGVVDASLLFNLSE
jgi:hypothetical protein